LNEGIIDTEKAAQTQNAPHDYVVFAIKFKRFRDGMVGYAKGWQK
jgi:hypothetical protein